jgi:hypothetical protein
MRVEGRVTGGQNDCELLGRGMSGCGLVGKRMSEWLSERLSK